MESSLSLVSIGRALHMCLLTPSPHSTAPFSAAVVIAIWTLPEELTPEWDKQPVGNQMVTDVDTMLESGNAWQCKHFLHLYDSGAEGMIGNVPGLQNNPVILSVSCMTSNVLVSFWC